jgi:hypothetical protein
MLSLLTYKASPTCITDEAQRAHLPDGLDEDVALVKTGEDLLQVVRSA